MICPTGALETDVYNEWSAPKVANTHYKVLSPHLDEAEAEGHFRRLVSKEQLGYDTPIYKTYNKYPQWIIGKGPKKRLK
jgi:hypothetical protein